MPAIVPQEILELGAGETLAQPEALPAQQQEPPLPAEETGGLRSLQAGFQRPHHPWDGRSYYVCRGHNAVVPERRCRTRHVPAVQLDELVWEDLCKVLTHPERVRNALERAHGGGWLPQEFKARLKTVGKAIGQIERQKRRLLDAYLGGVLELPEFERKRKELDGRCDTLLAQ